MRVPSARLPSLRRRLGDQFGSGGRPQIDPPILYGRDDGQSWQVSEVAMVQMHDRSASAPQSAIVSNVTNSREYSAAHDL